jgi:hypothetical protein
MKEIMTEVTTKPVSPGQTTGAEPEFGRIGDVERLYGLKRGSTYNLLAAGKIRGCLLRIKGKKSGVRLIHLRSVREFIDSQMKENAEKGGLQ